MKLWVYMSILTIMVFGLCIWDSVYTRKVFNIMEEKSSAIYNALLSENITDEEIKNDIIYINNLWTKKMDTLSVSISRKDMQPISDYLQYLHSSIINENQEDAITYSRLLNYNVIGLKETIGINLINLL